MKFCKGCSVEKPAAEFHKNAAARDGLSTRCKVCNCQRAAQWVKDNPERHKANAKRRRDELRPGDGTVKARQWAAANPERSKQIKRDWKKRNPFATLSANSRIHTCMSSRMRRLLKQNKAGRSWEKITGYNNEALRIWLESKFQPGMSWENYGQWHIDHIRPVSSFDFSVEPLEVARHCWALENLQPLWAIDNMRKGAKYEICS
jgi:hypothetical protein